MRHVAPMHLRERGSEGTSEEVRKLRRQSPLACCATASDGKAREGGREMARYCCATFRMRTRNSQILLRRCMRKRKKKSQIQIGKDLLPLYQKQRFFHRHGAHSLDKFKKNVQPFEFNRQVVITMKWAL